MPFHSIDHRDRETPWRLGGIRRHDGRRLLQAVKQRFEQVLHRRQGVVIAQRSHPFPQQTLAAHLGPHRLEQRATPLLDLIDEKRQHHQQGIHHREVLRAMAKIVLEVLALIFQCIACLIFNAPAGSTTPHDLSSTLSYYAA